MVCVWLSWLKQRLRVWFLIRTNAEVVGPAPSGCVWEATDQCLTLTSVFLYVSPSLPSLSILILNKLTSPRGWRNPLLGLYKVEQDGTGYMLTALLRSLFRGGCVTVNWQCELSPCVIVLLCHCQQGFLWFTRILEPDSVLRKRPALWDSTHFYMTWRSSSYGL